MLQRILQDTDSLKLWAQSYWNQSNPATGSSASRISSLPFFAQHGILPIFETAMDQLRYSGQSSLDYLSALESAARLASQRSEIIDILLLQLEFVSLPEPETLESAILADLDSGDTRIAAKLILSAAQMKAPLGNLSTITRRAAVVGDTEIIRLLIDTNVLYKDLNIGLWHSRTLLHASCLSDNVDLIQLFISMECAHTIQDDNEDTALDLACGYGKIKVAEYLARHILSKYTAEHLDGPSTENWETIKSASKVAISHEQSKVLQVLLEAVQQSVWKIALLEDMASQAARRSQSGCLRQIVTSYQLSGSTDLQLFRKALQEALERTDIPTCQLLMDVEGLLDHDLIITLLRTAVEDLSLESEAKSMTIIRSLCDKASKILATNDYLHLMNVALYNTADFQPVREVMIRYFVDQGADINTKNSSWLYPWDIDTILHYSAYRGRGDVVRVLISHGTDPNIPCGRRDWTAMHAGYDSVSVITALLEAKDVKINATDMHNGTALFYAAKWGEIEVLEVLLDRKPNLEIVAAEEGEKEHTALSKAFEMNRYGAVKLLLNAGANSTPLLKAAGDRDSTILHSCVRSNDAESLKILLLLNLNLNAKDEEGATALHYIDSETDVSVIMLLVNRGVPLEETNIWWLTPLCIAAEKNNFEVAEFLVSSGAKINIEAGDFGGPFHRACRYASLNMVKLLHKGGADINLADPSVSGTPLQAACHRQHDDEKHGIISYLLENGADVNKSSNWWGGAIYSACLACELEIVNLFLNKASAKPDTKDKMGRQPIHFALHRTKDFVEQLCGKGAELTTTDVMKRTALHFAAVSGRVDLINFVLDKHPEQRNARDIDGWTPLMWAMRTCNTWGVETSQTLKIAKALLKPLAPGDESTRLALGEALRTDRKWTALKLARYHGKHSDIIGLLTPATEEITDSPDREFWLQESNNQTRKALDNIPGFCDACLMVR
jgi:ankyrin repeat protein